MLPRVNVINGMDAKYLLFAMNDTISNCIYHNGIWENHIIEISQIFLARIKNNIHVLDIGANLGAFTVPIAKYLNGLSENDNEITSFEAQKIIYYQLCGNIFLNQIDNCTALHLAVSNNNEKLFIDRLDFNKTTNVGAFSLDADIRKLANNDTTSGTKDLTQAIRIDDYMADKKPVSLIKIDVEGYELKALQGAESTIRRSNFPPILFEAWNFEWFKNQKEKLFEFLSNLGYTFTHLGNDDYIAQNLSFDIFCEFIKNDSGSFNLKWLK